MKITTVPAGCYRDSTSCFRQNASGIQPLLHVYNLQLALAEVGLGSRVKTSGSKPARVVKGKAYHRWCSSQVKERQQQGSPKIIYSRQVVLAGSGTVTFSVL